MNILWLRKVIGSHVFPLTLLLIAFSFPFHKSISNVLIIFLALLWLIKGSIKSKIKEILNNKLTLLFTSTFFIYILCLGYTEDYVSGITMITRKLSFMLFPILLSTEQLKKSLVDRIFLSFIVSCIFATIISVLHVLYIHYFIQDASQSLSIESFYRENLTSYLGLDPPYFSLYISFSIILIIYFLFSGWRSLKVHTKSLALAILVYFILFLLLLSSRMTLFFLILISGILFIRFLSKSRSVKTILLLIVASVSIFYFVHKSSIIESRFAELINTEWAPPVGIYYNSTNLRIGILHCTYSLLKENWILGFGTGSAQTHLNACYEASGYSDVLYKEDYDTHNEYLNVWLNTGIVGLAVFLLAFGIPLMKAYKEKCYLYLAFLCLIILCCFTESLLERQNGIVFYAFFNSLFAFHVLKQT